VIYAPQSSPGLRRLPACAAAVFLLCAPVLHAQEVRELSAATRLRKEPQGIALASGRWESLGDAVRVEAFADHVAGDAALAARLAPFEVVVAMRERTPFTAERLAPLPALRLLITTGMANPSIDMAAARERGIVVCGTASLPSPTAELAWGLILALLRHIPAEDRAMRQGGWQHTIGPELAGRTLHEELSCRRR